MTEERRQFIQLLHYLLTPLWYFKNKNYPCFFVLYIIPSELHPPYWPKDEDNNEDTKEVVR